jgi:hypothetical protein
MAFALETTLNGDFFPLTPEQREAAEKCKAICIALTDESNDSNRLLIDTESEEHAELVKKIQNYVDETPIKIYADRGESGYSPKEVQELLECTTPDDISQWYCDRIEECEEHYRDCSVTEKEYLKEMWEEVKPEDVFLVDDDDNIIEDTDYEQPDIQILRDVMYQNDIYCSYDVSDVVDTRIRYTDAKIQAIPLTANCDRIYTPHFEQGEDENREEVAILNRLFKMDLHPTGKHPTGCQSWADANYSGSFMVFCGTLDLMEIITKTKVIPNTITVSPSDNYIFFDSSNGSGSGYEPKIRRAVTLRCLYRVDGLRGQYGYGVDETYGFSHSVWRDEHAASYQKWDDDVEGIYKDSKGHNRKIKVKG